MSTSTASVSTAPASIDKQLLYRMFEVGSYPSNWDLRESELQDLLDRCENNLCTTNGDVGPVEVTTRQLLLLLNAYAQIKLP